MPISDHEELGVNLHARPSCDSVAAVPIKKRHFMLAESLSLPSHMPSSLPPANCDVTPKSTTAESSVSEIGDQPALVTASTSKGSCESRVESIVSRDLNVAPEHETLPRSNHQRLRSNMAGKETSNEKELTPDNICALWPVIGSTQLLSTKEPFELPVKEGSGEGKPAPSNTSSFPTVSGNTEFQMAFKEPFGLPKDGQISEGCSVKKENLGSCSRNLALAERQQNIHSKCGDAESKVDSAHLCWNRSNWDLNTTMDTWEGLTDSAINNGSGEHDRLDLGGIYKKRLGLAPSQILCKEPDGTDATSGKCVLEKSDDHLTSSNSSSSMNEGSNSEACLDLQLKSSFVAESLFKWGSICPLGKLDSIKEMPFLSLSVKPLSSSCNPTLASCRVVKAEPNEESSQVGSRKMEAGGLKFADLKHVQSKPCEGQACSKNVGPSDLKSLCSRAVKSEPLEDQSQGFLRRLDNSSLTSQSTEKSLDVSEHVNKALLSLVPDFGMRHNGLQTANTSILQDPSQTVGEAQELISQAPIPHGSETHHSEKMPVSTGISQYEKGIVSKSSDLVQESLVSEDKKLNVFEGSRKMAASESPSESLLSNVKENIVADGKSEVVAQMCCSDDYNLSSVAPADELHIDSYGKSKVAESSEGKIELSTEALDTPCDHKKESNSSHSTAGAVDTVRKQFGDDDYEDGEVRDPALHGTAEGSCEEREGNQVIGADSICPVDVPVEVPSCVDLKGDKIENSDKIKIHGSINCDGSQCGHKDDPGISTTSNLHESSADGLLTAGSGKRKLGKTIHKITRDHLKDKGPERKPKSDRALSARTVAEGSHDEVSSQQENARGSVPLIAKVSVSSKTELSIKDDAKNDANDKGSRPRIVNLNPAPNGLTPGKTKSVLGKLISSRIEKEMLIEKSRSRRIRDEKCKYRSRIFDHERSKDQPVGRCPSDLMHIRSRADNRLNALHGDRNSDHEHVFEKIDSSAGARFPRPINASEVAITDTSDGSFGNAGRMTRKLLDDELQNLSHMPCRRRSPGGRGQIPVGIQLVRHPIRDISPSSYIGRDVPDFVLRAHEERLVRTLPDDMMVPPLSRPQYERAEDSLIRRERKSLSPIQRRGPPHFPPICLESSPISQARSHPQWFSSRRSPDGFDGPPELISCRSPRTIMPDRMRSHNQRLCFAEDMIVRRRGSPPYIARLPDDGDIGPSREHDFPRPVRGLHRNIRRFDMVDPREISEQFFRPLLRNQFGELAGDVECVVDRSCNERHVLGRFRQWQTLSDEDNESFRSHVDGGPSGPFRFCPEGNEAFPDTGSPRDPERHIRNRLGSRLRFIEEQEDNSGPFRFCPEGNEAFPDTGSPRDSERHIRNRLGSRLRFIEEQEDNSMYHGEAGWRNASSTDVRLKRRRLERH